MVVDARIKFDVRPLRDSTERRDIHIERATPHDEDIYQFLPRPRLGIDTIEMTPFQVFGYARRKQEWTPTFAPNLQ